jgi:alpha,alpha-trehalase
MARSPGLPAASLVDYGIIGDLHSAALVSVHGSIDWLCWPRFDSPSAFAALLDPERGGFLRVAPLDAYRSSQQYEPRTNVLRTEFVTERGRATLIAFMPVAEIDGQEYGEQEVHLQFRVTEGTVDAGIEYAPRLHYGLKPTTLESARHGVLASHGPERVALSTPAPLAVQGDVATGQWSGTAGESLGLVLRYGESLVAPFDAAAQERKHHRTSAFWENWCSRGRYEGPWSGAVLRSALTLRLLTYAPTGALVAAATTSLPETIGGSRNWDYRFSWVRDSSFTVSVLHGLGYAREARRYLRWLRRLLRGTVANIGQLSVCYGLEGETDLTEVELPHLRGYLDSRPVRIGNEAAKQFQLDIFGSLADAIHLAYGSPEGHPDEAWRSLQALADHVAAHWQEPDHGIWEIRGPKARYTHSALMSWVALDRAIQVAVARGCPERAAPWQEACGQVRDAILAQGWSRERGSFVQAFGSDAADASLLLMPIVGFLPADDPRVQATVHRIRDELGTGPFVHRYRAPDGLAGEEGAFLMCSFWMVEALALMGETEEAASRFQALCRLAGPLGLFTEEVDPRTCSPLGNFPQALTHLSHIQAALALQRAAPHAPVQGPGGRIEARATAAHLPASM